MEHTYGEIESDVKLVREGNITNAIEVPKDSSWDQCVIALNHSLSHIFLFQIRNLHRNCVDLTQLNQNVQREFYPLPQLEETLSSLGRSRYFSKMDANSGFWQIGLSEESRKYTTLQDKNIRWIFISRFSPSGKATKGLIRRSLTQELNSNKKHVWSFKILV